MFFGFFGDPALFSVDFDDFSVFDDFSTFFSVFDFSTFLLLVPFSLGFELFFDPFETNFPFSRANIGLSESVTFFESLFFESLFSVSTFFVFSALGFFSDFDFGEFSAFLSDFLFDSSFFDFFGGLSDSCLSVLFSLYSFISMS